MCLGCGHGILIERVISYQRQTNNCKAKRAFQRNLRSNFTMAVQSKSTAQGRSREVLSIDDSRLQGLYRLY